MRTLPHALAGLALLLTLALVPSPARAADAALGTFDDAVYSSFDGGASWTSTPTEGFVCDLDCWLGSYATTYTPVEPWRSPAF